MHCGSTRYNNIFYRFIALNTVLRNYSERSTMSFVERGVVVCRTAKGIKIGINIVVYAILIDRLSLMFARRIEYSLGLCKQEL